MSRTARRSQWLGALTIGSIGLGLVVAVRRLPIDAWRSALEGWIGGLGAWGPVAFGSVYVVAVVLMLPALPLTIAAGALFGLVVGTMTASIASTLGAALAFLIARHLARDRVARRFRDSPRFEAIDRAIGAGGWRVVGLLRLSPAVPFGAQNYLYGITRIGFWPCVLTSWAAMLPATILYAQIGHAGRLGIGGGTDGARPRSSAEWASLGVGLLASRAAVVYVSALARRAWRDRGSGKPDGPDRVSTGVDRRGRPV